MGTLTPRTVTLRDGSSAVLRSPRPDEWAALRDALREMAAASPYIASQPDELKSDEAYWTTRITEWNASASDLIAVAEHHGRLAGDCSLKTAGRRRLNHHAELGMGFIPSARGVGLGRALLTAVLDWAADHPTLEQIHLGVIPENTHAVRLYDALGFRVTGRQPCFFKQPDGRYHDHLSMTIFVKPSLAPPGAGVYRRRETGPGV